MEKILLVQVGASETSQIKKLAENKGIRVISASEKSAGCRMEELVMGKSREAGSDRKEAGLPKHSLMVFCDVSDKHFEKLLFEMRSKKIAIDYKAVLTETNRNWTLERLYMELEKERIMTGAKKTDHQCTGAPAANHRYL